MGWLNRTPDPSPQVVSGLIRQAGLEGRQKAEARLKANPDFLEEGLGALFLGRLSEIIDEQDTSAVEALSLPMAKLLAILEPVSREYYSAYAQGLLKAPGGEARCEEFKAVLERVNARFGTTKDATQRIALAVEAWRRVPVGTRS